MMATWWGRLRQLASTPARNQVWNDSRDWPVIGKGHLHPNPTVVLCVQGVVRIERPDGRVDLQAGDSLFLAAGVWHRHAPLNRGAVWLGQGFLPAWSDLIMVGADARWIGKLPLQPTLGLVQAGLAAPVAERDAVAMAWLRQLVDEQPADLDFQQPILQPMVELMWRRFHVGVTVEDLVRVSGASRSAAYKTFTSYYGLPPREAIIACRLTMAEALLAQGLAVAEVAWRCGFGNPDTFTRCWRRRHGSAPRGHRHPGQGSRETVPLATSAGRVRP
jgi:AraC-like DNA-binding protein